MQSKSIKLRKARQSDAEILFAWQSDSSTRRYFRNRNIPTLKQHLAWFERALADQNSELLLLEEHGRAVGSVRLDGSEKGNHWEVSIIIAPESRSCGIGTAALKLVRRQYKDRWLVAEVLPGNDASRSAFLKAGFTPSIRLGRYVAGPDRKEGQD